MKKLLLIILVGLTFSAMAQKPHKATGDKPLYSKLFEMYGKDSVCSNATVYKYDANQVLVKTIDYYEEDSDSTLYQYDQDGRATSINLYMEGELIGSTVWIYDEANSRIDNYVLEKGMEISLDTVLHTVYYGVKDMDGVSEDMSLLGMDLAIRDCDSIVLYMNMYDGNALLPVVAIYPVYNGDLPETATLTIASELIAEITGMSLFDISIDLTFVHTDQKLTSITGATVLDLSGMNIPVPVPLSDFLTVTNQYSGDFLTEMKTEVKVTIPLVGDAMYMGIKVNYLYNSENNKICEVVSYSEEKKVWDVEAKTWYYYENPVEDIALISMTPSGSEKDIAGDNMGISVNLENTGLTQYTQVALIAKIVSASGKEFFYETIPFINPFVSMTYDFDTTYTVPNDSIYTITVYLQSIDNNTKNDTLSVTRFVKNEVSTPSIESNRFSMSQNFPNPAKDNTVISYSIPQDGEVNFNIYSINGQLLYNKKENASFGEQQIQVNLSDYASGIYIYTLEYQGQRITKRMNVER